MNYIPECDVTCVFECVMFYLGLLFQGIEGSTAIGVTQVVTTSVGMTDIDIRAVSETTANSVYFNGRKPGFLLSGIPAMQRSKQYTVSQERTAQQLSIKGATSRYLELF